MKQPKLIWIGLIVGFMAFVGTVTIDTISAQDVQSYSRISAVDAKQMIEKNSDIFILDVRTPEEFTGPLGHLKGATLIPLDELAARVAELAPYKGKKMVVVCHSGGRSARAGRFLAGQGFNIYDVAGGMRELNALKANIER